MPPKKRKPGLKVEREMIWCAEHLAPFEARWPVGYLAATLRLLDIARERRDVRRAVAGREDRLGSVLLSLGPVCCLVARDDPGLVAEVVRRALVGDPKLVAEVKRRSGARRTARWNAERLARKAWSSQHKHVV